MSILSLSLVNQKLAYARSLVALISVPRSDDTPKESLQRQALLDAAVMHMVCAYQHYLREIAESYFVKGVSFIKVEQDLIKVLQEAGKSPADAQELQRLHADESSWLSRLFFNYERQWAFPVVQQVKQEPVNDSLIVLVDMDVSDEKKQVTLSLLSAWYKQLVELIQRQRETRAEY
jgi:hypothetical protein